MRPVIETIVQNLTGPDAALLAEARRASEGGEDQARFLSRMTALHEIERAPPRQPRRWSGRLRLAALNAERLKNRPAVRRLMRQAEADVILLSEVDLGMARSGNVHNIRDLIGDGREGYLYGVEFVELDLGDEAESRDCAGGHNARSLHGNALVTGLALEAPHLIPLEENGLWFPGFKGWQRRVGGRMALAGRVAAAPGPLWIVSTHLESKSDPADRQAQIRNLLRALEALAPGEPCIVVGDFNTKALPRGGDAWPVLLEEPGRHEPLFDDLRRAGFTWVSANLAAPTQRAGPSNKHEPPFGKLDWIVVRGVMAENPQVLPAVDQDGRDISDHEMLVVDIRF